MHGATLKGVGVTDDAATPERALGAPGEPPPIAHGARECSSVSPTANLAPKARLDFEGHPIV